MSVYWVRFEIIMQHILDLTGYIEKMNSNSDSKVEWQEDMMNFLTLNFLSFPSIAQLSRDKDYWLPNIKYCNLPSKGCIINYHQGAGGY